MADCNLIKKDEVNKWMKLFLEIMPLPDPIWIYFIQLGHVAGFKQKRSECKVCKHQINH